MTLLAGVLFGILALVGYGTSDFLGALSARKTTSLQTTLLSRIVVLALLLIVFLAFFKFPQLSDTTILLLLLTGTLSAIGLLIFYQGLKVGHVSIVTPIVSGWSVVTLALSMIFLNQSLTVSEAAGVFLVILGTVWASVDPTSFRKLAKGRLMKGAVYAIGAMFIFGMSYFLTNVLVQRIGWFMPSLLSTAVLVAILSIYFKASNKKHVKINSSVWFIAGIGIFSVIAYLAYGLGVFSEAALIVPPIAAASPLVTILLANLKLKEKLSFNHKLGISAIILGIVILSL